MYNFIKMKSIRAEVQQGKDSTWFREIGCGGRAGAGLRPCMFYACRLAGHLLWKGMSAESDADSAYLRWNCTL